MELGMKIEERMLNIFKDVSGGEWYLYSLDERDKSFLASTTGEDNYPIDIDQELARSLNNGEIIKIENSSYIIQMIPILNYSGKYNTFLKRVFDNSELISLRRSYTKRYITHGVLASIVSALFFWLLLTYLLDPLIYLEKKVRKLESGNLWDPIQVKSNDEIGYLAAAMENMRQSLYIRENELKEQSYTDPLTGAYNRLYFEHILDEIINEELYPVTLIMADIDELKQINDNEGHAEGDVHIVKCTEIIQSAMRDNDFIFRIGGDEFILVFPSTGKETGEAILKRIKGEFEIYNSSLTGDDKIISVSFGLATCQGGAECLKKTISIADKEMYKNKNYPEN